MHTRPEWYSLQSNRTGPQIANKDRQRLAISSIVREADIQILMLFPLAFTVWTVRTVWIGFEPRFEARGMEVVATILGAMSQCVDAEVERLVTQGTNDILVRERLSTRL